MTADTQGARTTVGVLAPPLCRAHAEVDRRQGEAPHGLGQLQLRMETNHPRNVITTRQTEGIFKSLGMASRVRHGWDPAENIIYWKRVKMTDSLRHFTKVCASLLFTGQQRLPGFVSPLSLLRTLIGLWLSEFIFIFFYLYSASRGHCLKGRCAVVPATSPRFLNHFFENYNFKPGSLKSYFFFFAKMICWLNSKKHNKDVFVRPSSAGLLLTQSRAV